MRRFPRRGTARCAMRFLLPSRLQTALSARFSRACRRSAAHRDPGTRQLRHFTVGHGISPCRLRTSPEFADCGVFRPSPPVGNPRETASPRPEENGSFYCGHNIHRFGAKSKICPAARKNYPEKYDWTDLKNILSGSILTAVPVSCFSSVVFGFLRGEIPEETKEPDRMR